MRWSRRFLTLALLTSAVLQSAQSHAQLKPGPEKHDAPAAVAADSGSQKNQSALYTALIDALHAITHQEKASAEQTRTENESWLTPLRIQKGLLIVGIVYSLFAWKPMGRALESNRKSPRSR